MQRESVLRHALVQHFQHSLGVILSRKADDEVIRIADEPCAPLETRLDVALEPEVEHVVQVHVAEHRGDDRPLCGTLVRPAERLAVEDPHMKTFANQPQERRIGHPDLEHLQQLLTVDAVEECLDVGLQDHSDSLVGHHLVHGSKRIVGTTVRSEPIRAFQEVLFVHCFQNFP